MRTLDQIISSLPAERRAKITARGQKLISEEKALRHLRQARELTQQGMATLLGIDQTGVSRIESRSDMLISTLRSYVVAMGGTLRVMVDFPDGAVEVLTLGEVADVPANHKASKKKAPRPRLVHPD